MNKLFSVIIITFNSNSMQTPILWDYYWIFIEDASGLETSEKEQSFFNIVIIVYFLCVHI